jgi:hypothetical protein
LVSVGDREASPREIRRSTEDQYRHRRFTRVRDGKQHRGGAHIARLKKADAARLLDTYDADPIAALTRALRIALDQPRAEWPDLIAAARLDHTRRDRLLNADVAALDELAAELNERRTL